MEEDLARFESCDLYEDYYQVEKILDKKKYKGVWKYKVKWEGWSMNDCTWEPIENLEGQAMFLVEEFENKAKKKNAKKPKIIKEEEEKEKESDQKNAASKIPESNGNKNQEVDMVVDDVVNIEANLDEHTPDKILTATILNDSPLELNCLVSWEVKDINTNTTPKSTWISSNIIRKKNPELLLKYYESKVKFPGNSSNNNKLNHPMNGGNFENAETTIQSNS